MCSQGGNFIGHSVFALKVRLQANNGMESPSLKEKRASFCFCEKAINIAHQTAQVQLEN